MPGSKHACPTVAACWSPATPRIGISWPKRSARVIPKSAAQSLTSGNMAIGMFSRSQILLLHRPFRISYISVRAALVASVTCSFPPVSFQIRKLSTVPNNSSPASARSRAPSTLSSTQFSLVPEKYGSSKRPVLLVTISS